MSKRDYYIPVTRISYGFAVIHVQAEAINEAEQMALDQAGNHEFSEKSADYELTDRSVGDKDETLDLLKRFYQVVEHAMQGGAVELTRLHWQPEVKEVQRKLGK